jgi:TfoX/Sxy family transcriptional regulator of competence genes
MTVLFFIIRQFCTVAGKEHFMASTKDYLDYVLEQLGDVQELSHRAMMGEYILYVEGKVFGGIYDNRFLIKPTKSAREMLPDAPMELPYEGAKEMLLVDELDDRALLTQVVTAMADELPAPKKKRK